MNVHVGLDPPSAVEAFWKTFSPRPTTLVPRRAKTNNLPVELLMTIFKLVHEQEKLEMDDLYWPHSAFFSPSLFPYAIASVCSLWRDAMSLIPECWTRFVIVIDMTPAILPSAILSQLSWSRDLPLDVVITRKDFDHPADRQHERAQVMSIMSILINPHLHRIQILHFDVIFSSSLPQFYNGFRGTANILVELRLDCRTDNGSPANGLETDTLTEQQFPVLEDLSIAGRSYFDACAGDSQFALKFVKVRRFGISHYKPLPGEPFLVSNFLRPITMFKCLKYLCMNDLILNPSLLPLPTSTIPPTLNELLLDGIHDSQSLTEIFSVLTNTSKVIVTRSAIRDAEPIHSEEYLTLDDIDADQDLVPFLRNWEGGYLTVKSCPSFNDAVLRMMSPRPGRTPNAAHYLDELEIVDCPNFSVAALKYFVSAKSDIYQGFVIRSLRISGNAPVISPEDRRWLSERLMWFEVL